MLLQGTPPCSPLLSSTRASTPGSAEPLGLPSPSSSCLLSTLMIFIFRLDASRSTAPSPPLLAPGSPVTHAKHTLSPFSSARPQTLPQSSQPRQRGSAPAEPPGLFPG